MYFYYLPLLTIKRGSMTTFFIHVFILLRANAFSTLVEIFKWEFILFKSLYFFCVLLKLKLTFLELPEMSIMLPPFVDSTHCLSYNLTRKGRSVADRIVSVLGYACPDITYSPSLYPITALLLHFMPGIDKIFIFLIFFLCLLLY